MPANEMVALAEAFAAPFGELGSSPERDRGTVVLSWPSVPPELVRAAGFSPVFARGAATPTPAADAVLEAGVFPGRIHQLFEAALQGRLARVAAIVLPRTSDSDYKAYLYLKEMQRQGMPLPPVLLLDLLQSAGPDVLDYNAARMRELFVQLTRLAGRRVALETLRTQLTLGNAARAAARRIAALRTGRPRLAGAEAVQLLGACWQMQPERYRALAERAAEAITTRLPRGGPRLLLAGAPVDSPALHAAIETLPATVVAELGPFGNGAAAEAMDVAPDPFVALADWHARNVVTPRLTGVTLAARVVASLADIDAAVILLPPSDARFGWEHPRLRQLLDSHGIPHLALQLEPEATLLPGQLQAIERLLGSITQPAVARHG